ncbi:DUF917 domain-containing protein [Microbacterium sp. HD4P20]|uniref:DUF917 domain-containing protein n=1 Tax=Microbacterium sp. HD4P20 TaxID=2864874 RepID=UPI001C63F392|nr:DUF917 domain-containing protein [Microbacterium sp. HD4P20]MCP2635430.1 DUF917 domain-containing protein [Microbacterium sp. HD4P20]
MAQSSPVAPATGRLTEITADDIAALGVGTAIFGTGGGGAVYTAQITVENALRTHGPVPLVAVDELGPDDVVILMSGIGAPTVGIEMLSATGQIHALLAEAERLLGRSVTTLMAAEIGGSNGVQPIGWAARLGLKVLDADGMGRAFPNAAMVAMNVAGVPCEWAVQSDVVGNISVMKTIDLSWLERHARALTVASGSICIGAHYPMTAETVKGAVIEGTVSAAIRVGHALMGSSDPVAAISAELDARVLLTGKISDLDRRTVGGFVRGSVTITGTGADRGRLQRLEVQNENLLVLEDGEVLVSVPDLITIIDAETGHAITTEMLRFGQRVAVLAWACDPIWRTPRGLELAGPSAFGYDLPYVPFEGAHR